MTKDNFIRAWSPLTKESEPEPAFVTAVEHLLKEARRAALKEAVELLKATAKTNKDEAFFHAAMTVYSLFPEADRG